MQKRLARFECPCQDRVQHAGLPAPHCGSNRLREQRHRRRAEHADAPAAGHDREQIVATASAPVGALPTAVLRGQSAMALPKTPAAAGYALFETEFGVCAIAWSARGVVRVVLPEASVEETETRVRRQAKTATRMKPPEWVAPAIGAVQAYFLGEQVDLSTVPLDLAHEPEFERRVYDVLRRIGWAATTTYGRLADAAGSPGAARAVGRAMARNPVPV